MQLTELLKAALLRQRQGDLQAAEAMIRQAIHTFGPTPDSSHLLGLVRARQGDLRDGVALIAGALDACGWSVDSYQRNLALMTARLLRQRAERVSLPPAQSLYGTPAVDANRSAVSDATVSVVLLVNGNMPGVRASLASVTAQTHRPESVIVVTDGGELIKLPGLDFLEGHSLFSSNSLCSPCLSATTLANHANAAIRATTSTFVQPLLAGDELASDRVKKMLTQCSHAGAVVGLSRIQVMDGQTVVDELSDPWVFAAACAQSAISASATVGLSLLQRDVGYGLGNLFLDRNAFDALGGFDEATSQFSWVYLLKTLWFQQPVFVDLPLYRLQRDALNGWRTTLASEAEKNSLETQLRRWWRRTFDHQTAANPQTPDAVRSDDELFMVYLENRASAQDRWEHLPAIVNKVLATEA